MKISSTILRILLLVTFIIGISLLHYLTPLDRPALHDVYQRLYYLPIILSAFWFGFRGGILSALLVCVVYAPHILFQWGDHMAIEMEKYLELVLYNVVGGVTGLLSEREQQKNAELLQTAQGLEESNVKLQVQSQLIIEIEEQLRKAERFSTIGELSASIAHEVRNPLGSIRGTAEILKEDFQPGDAKYEFFEILLKETARLNRVVEDFLRLARPRPAVISDCDVVKELENVVTLVSADARSRKVHLEIKPISLPIILGDKEKLRQAFLNLILNGIQATPPGGRIVISVSSDHKNTNGDDMVMVEFADTGMGIPAGEIDKVFEPFFTTKEEGTGLGLATTRKIIEKHGGRIEVESEPGHGAAFRIFFPASA
ncbi:MAG: two-component system sensor histidine kinase NtrB [Desulfuromonadales bacterium]|jgi:signal transduction histidine kinase